MQTLRSTIFISGLLAAQVAAHGHVTNIVINGVSYRGWDINSDPYNSNPPLVAAWQTPNTANGFISPDAYDTSDVICHLNATNGQGHIQIAAGDKISLQWTTWPDSHHGPVLDYLANCGGSCETVDKTTLKFFKIDGVGLVDETTVPGVWGDDQMIENNNSWMVEIPPTIAPGNYVLRHELIALHGAGSENGAQNYMQCFNLKITGTGSVQPSGVLGTELYTPTDPGILVNIYTSISYIVPGPTLIPQAVSIVQSSSAITASGTATAGSSSGGTTTSATTTSSTTLVTTTKTSTTTTKSATTTSKVSTTTAAGGTQTVYGQCGGTGWTGATACVASATCTTYNAYYAQCIPTST
ncbi:glycosyl hydrolase family 61-domain-containing protein [Aspergillus ambiguus]|uniref:glycosyl hydrolase family 61-domain-containing protein n=1 Tax=Aspergillus ambiguus TaxID=176160 RepID=UPI003CCD0CE4